MSHGYGALETQLVGRERRRGGGGHVFSQIWKVINLEQTCFRKDEYLYNLPEVV